MTGLIVQGASRLKTITRGNSRSDCDDDDVTRHSGWWPNTVTPSIDRTLQQLLTITDLDLITKFDFLPIVQGFHGTYATGAACQQRTLTPPDTWSCPTLGLACVLMSRPISPELVLSPDFWISNTPRYFSFACNITSIADSIIYSYHMCMRATVSLSAPRQELLSEGFSPRATFRVEGLTNWPLPELHIW